MFPQFLTKLSTTVELFMVITVLSVAFIFVLLKVISITVPE